MSDDAILTLRREDRQKGLHVVTSVRIIGRVPDEDRDKPEDIRYKSGTTVSGVRITGDCCCSENINYQ